MMRFSQKFLLGMVLYHILITVTFIVIYCVKNAVPTEIYVCQVPPLITEFFILYKLELNGRKNKDMAEQ